MGQEGRQSGDLGRVRDLYAGPSPLVAEPQAEGLAHRAIADRIKAECHTTRRDAVWNSMQVARVLDRAGPELEEMGLEAPRMPQDETRGAGPTDGPTRRHEGQGTDQDGT